MFRKQKCPFLTAGRTKIKTFAGKRAPVRGVGPSWAERWERERAWKRRLELVAGARKELGGDRALRPRVPWGSWAGKKETGYGVQMDKDIEDRENRRLRW